MGQSVGDLKLRLNLQSDAKSVLGSAASSVADLQAAIGQVEKNAATARAAMKGLVGSDEAVKAAKKDVIAQLKAEKDELGQLKLRLLEVQNARPKGLVGGALAGMAAGPKALKASAIDAKSKIESLVAAVKKLPAAAKGAVVTVREQGAGGVAKRAGGAIGGALGRLDEKAGALAAKAKDAASALAGGAKASALAGASDLAGTALVGLEGAVVGAVVALPGLALGLAAAVTKFGDVERSAALARQALFGTAEQAKNVGTWVDGLASKFGTAREAVQTTALALRKGGLGGDAFTASLEASTAAAAALGPELASKVDTLTTRFGRRQNRFSLGRMELDGTGLDFEDVATALGKSTKKGVGYARNALMSGRLTVAEGAGALKDAIQAKFGDVIEAKKISLDSIGTRAKDNFSKLFSAVKIDPILRAVSKLVDMLDTSSGSGSALASTFNGVAIIAGKIAEAALPKVQELLLGSLLISLKTANAILEWYIGFKKGEGVIASVVGGLKDAFEWLSKMSAKAVDFAKQGAAVAAGFAKGIRGGKEDVASASEEMVDIAEFSIRNKAQIHSPSRLMAGLGGHMGDGFAGGMVDSLPAVSAAARSLVDVPSLASNTGFSSGSVGGAIGSSARTLTINLQLPEGSTDSGASLSQAFASGEFRVAIVSALQDMAAEAP